MSDVPHGRIFLAVFLNGRETSTPFGLIILVHDSGDCLNQHFQNHEQSCHSYHGSRTPTTCALRKCCKLMACTCWSKKESIRITLTLLLLSRVSISQRYRLIERWRTEGFLYVVLLCSAIWLVKVADYIPSSYRMTSWRLYDGASMCKPGTVFCQGCLLSAIKREKSKEQFADRVN